MKTKNIYILLLLLVGVFSSCKEDLTDTGEPYFNFKDVTEASSPTGLDVDYAGNTTGQQYVIRSNRSWKIVAATENDWVKFFPNEGDDDGIVKLIVSENKTFVDRQMLFTYIVDGEEQPVVFTVNQGKATPYLTVSDIAGKNINQTAQSFDINVKANVAYTFSSDASWLTLTNSVKGVSSTTLSFAATVNENLTSRTGNVSFVCAEFPALNVTLKVVQEGKGEGTVVFFENFDWLAFANTNHVFWDATNPKRFDLWTQTEWDHGWTSTPNAGSSNQPLLYATLGAAKLGKTSYGGDLISPKLANIVGTQNVLVKFKAVPYMTNTGTKDGNSLVISVIGGGTPSQTNFTIDNWPTYPAFSAAATTDALKMAEHEAYCAAFWNEPGTERSFTITGATANTQIRFLGGAMDLTTAVPNKNRMFLDDIKVLIPN